MHQLFHETIMMENEGKRKTQYLQTAARTSKPFERMCLYCDKLDHKWAEGQQTAPWCREWNTQKPKDGSKRRNTDFRTIENLNAKSGIHRTFSQILPPTTVKRFPIGPDTVQGNETRRGSKPGTGDQTNPEKGARFQPTYGRLRVW